VLFFVAFVIVLLKNKAPATASAVALFTSKTTPERPGIRHPEPELQKAKALLPGVYSSHALFSFGGFCDQT
jgi:hypothetical protein